MDLIRDLLDKRVVDRNGRETGRVDAVVLEMRRDAPPRVTEIAIGPGVLAQRISPLFGRCVEAFEHIFGVDEGRPVRLKMAQVVDMHDHVKVDVAFGETPAGEVELRLRRWVGRIPGVS